MKSGFTRCLCESTQGSVCILTVRWVSVSVTSTFYELLQRGLPHHHPENTHTHTPIISR